MILLGILELCSFNLHDRSWNFTWVVLRVRVSCTFLEEMCPLKLIRQILCNWYKNSDILIKSAYLRAKLSLFCWRKTFLVNTFIFSWKTQENCNGCLQKLKYFIKTQGKNSFFGKSIIQHCRNQVKRKSLS